TLLEESLEHSWDADSTPYQHRVGFSTTLVYLPFGISRVVLEDREIRGINGRFFFIGRPSFRASSGDLQHQLVTCRSPPTSRTSRRRRHSGHGAFLAPQPPLRL